MSQRLSMPNSLKAIHQKLTARVRTLDGAFDRQVVNATAIRMTDRIALQEGLVSSLWQSWNAFCRETLIGSAIGITDSAGIQISSPYIGRSEMEIAFIAKELSKRKHVRNVIPLQGRHLEPTWGDLDKVNLIATGIASSNQHKLLSAFGLGLTLKDLQLCRNASAHINKDKINEVARARVRYSDTKFNHPSDMIFWVDPLTRDFVWKTWVDEMNSISIAACD